MAQIKVTNYKVAGAFEFPLDMLRYDNAWPRHEGETAKLASAMHLMHSPRDKGIVEVELQCIGTPSLGRWESFMWHVTEIDGRRIKS